MSMVALQLVRSTVPRALYLDMARLTTRGLTRSRLAGIRLARTRRPIVPARSMTVLAMTPAAWMTWSRAAFRAMVKLARSGSVPGTVLAASAMAVRRAWQVTSRAQISCSMPSGVRARRTRPPRIADLSSK